jgi:hypothetical protein
MRGLTEVTGYGTNKLFRMHFFILFALRPPPERSYDLGGWPKGVQRPR